MSDKEMDFRDCILNQIKKVYQHFDLDFNDFKKDIVITKDEDFESYKFYKTSDDTITIMDYEKVKNKEKYKNLTKNMYDRQILINLVFDILLSFSNVQLDKNHIYCFYYGIANYFLKQKKVNFITHVITKDDIYKECTSKSSRIYEFAIADYIMSNYSKDKIYEYLKDPRLLKEDEEKIIDEFNKYNADEKNSYAIKEKFDNISIYSKDYISSINETIKAIKENNKRLYEFFEISENDLKEITILPHNKEEYIKVVAEHSMEYRPSSCGFAALNNIVHVLKYDDYTNTDCYKGASLSDYNEMILHEIVHQYHNWIIVKKVPEARWFREGIACNLGNPSHFKIVNLNPNISCDDIYTKRIEYNIFFTLTKHVLQKYSKEEILEFCKYGNKVAKILPEILDDIKGEKTKKTKCV